MFNVTDGSSVDEIEILEESHSTDFGQDTSKEARDVLGIVAPEHELDDKLGEAGLDTLPEPAERGEERFPVFLVGTGRDFQTDAGRLEQVQLDVGAEVCLVADEGAMAVISLDILQVMDVVDGGLGEVEGMDDPAQTAEGMELVTVVIAALGGAETEGGGFVEVFPAHGAAFGTSHAADLHRLGIDAEEVLPAVHCGHEPFAQGLAEGAVNFLRSLYCRREMRLGIRGLQACRRAKRWFSLSMPRASADRLRATTSRSEKEGTTPRRGTLPFSLTRFPAFCLQMSRILANIANKLCIQYL